MESVLNKYNLEFSDIGKLQVVDRNKICEPLFWRNNIIGAWCISREFGTAEDIRFGTSNSAWIGVYDKRTLNKFVRCYCTSYGGMCGYNFKKFFNPKDIENELDLQTQEFVLETFNKLIDEGILALPKTSK